MDYFKLPRDKFQDPAMDRWATIQSFNQADATLRDINEIINNRTSVIISTILSIASTYFLAKKNWLLTILMLIVVEVFTIYQIKTPITQKNELRKVKEEITKVCKEHGIEIPDGIK